VSLTGLHRTARHGDADNPRCADRLVRRAAGRRNLGGNALPRRAPGRSGAKSPSASSLVQNDAGCRQWLALSHVLGAGADQDPAPPSAWTALRRKKGVHFEKKLEPHLFIQGFESEARGDAKLAPCLWVPSGVSPPIIPTAIQTCVRPSKQLRRGELVRPLPSPLARPRGSWDPSTHQRPIVRAMSQTPSLSEAIEALLASDEVPSIGGEYVNHQKREDATAVDRAFLESWRNRADDPIWSRTLATIRTCYRPHTPYVWMVARALRANRMAEGARAGIDIVFERRQNERRELLDLAGMAEALANHLGGLDKETAAWSMGFFPSAIW
jgi:hypothetical protein